MSEEQRRLAAIMFTDMVGYSALAQRNEALALELLEEHRRVLRPIFPKHDGREVETAGDAFLVEFASALEATRCAIEIQRTLAERNQLESRERQILLRIGIHVGDVVHKDQKVMGDAVNIAARIEPLAEAGGICVTRAVFEQIENKIEVPLVQLGEPELKNIRVPVVVYRLGLPGTGATETRRVALGPRIRRAVTVSIAAALVVGPGVWLVLKFGSGRPPISSSQRGVSRAQEQKSIAVLPFDNFSAEKDTEYLSDGITEEITTALSRVTGLKVAARGSAFAFKGKREDVRRVSEVLHVTTVLEGSVRKAGNQIRVTAQLINTEGFHVWATNYDRGMDNLLAVQAEIAQQIADKLQLELSGAEQKQLAKRPTEKPEAHELYLKGLYWWNKRNKPSLEKAVEFFTQALDKDPSYALAHAGLAACFVIMPEYASSPPKEFYAKARASALRALELDNSLAEAHAVLGLVWAAEYDWAAAEGEYKLVIKLNPSYASAHQWYSSLLRMQGRFGEAMAEIRRAHELDPLSIIILRNIGECLYFEGEDDLAIQEFRKGLELDPDFMSLFEALGMIHLKKGLLDEARADFEKSRALAGDSPFGLGLLGYTHARLGNTAEALRILARLEELAKKGSAVQYYKAMVQFGLGDRDKTFESLEKARLDSEDISDINVSPFWAELRADPRSTELLRKIHLAK